jgi:alpha-glucosidase
MAFNFPFMGTAFTARALRAVVERTEATLPAHAQPVWTLSNHDAPRFVTRWCGDDPGKARGALLLLMCLRGTPLLYYGDELGLPDVPVPPAAARDPLAAGTLPGKDGRDPCRTPMPWDASEHYGFGARGAAPWLPTGPRAGMTAADQEADPASTLQLTRRLVALRAAEPDLRRAPVRFRDARDARGAVADDVLVIDRGGLRATLNLSDRPHRLGAGEVLVATAPLDGAELPGWSGAIARRPA